MGKKDTKPATLSDIRQALQDFWEEVWQEAFDPVLSQILDRLGKVEDGLGTVKDDVGQLKSGQQDIKRQLNDIKMDTPTQKEFEELKARVDRYHPIS